MTPLSLEQVMARVERLPTASPALRDVLGTVSGQELDLGRLISAVSGDPALSARVLRIANSPFFGLSRRIDSVRKAAVLIGGSSLRSLVVAAGLMGQFGGGSGGAEALAVFWHHCMSVAIFAKELAVLLGEDRESAFVAGILHDLGRLVLLTQFPSEYAAVEELAGRPSTRGHLAAEQEILGFDHAQVGSLLAERWHLPANITAAIRWHAEPGLEARLLLIDLVSVSERLTYMNDKLPLVQRESAPELEDDPAWRRLGLGWSAARDGLGATASVGLKTAEALLR